MIVQAVFQLNPNFGRIAQTNGFVIFTQAVLEKDITARDYCIFGSQIFQYKQKAFLDKIVEYLRQWVMALLMPILTFVASL
eukprot:7134862-Ditylum_brightwellii.AAC.1